MHKVFVKLNIIYFTSYLYNTKHAYITLDNCKVLIGVVKSIVSNGFKWFGLFNNNVHILL